MLPGLDSLSCRCSRGDSIPGALRPAASPAVPSGVGGFGVAEETTAGLVLPRAGRGRVFLLAATRTPGTFPTPGRLLRSLDPAPVQFRVVDARRFGGQTPGRSVGYLPDGPDGDLDDQVFARPEGPPTPRPASSDETPPLALLLSVARLAGCEDDVDPTSASTSRSRSTATSTRRPTARPSGSSPSQDRIDAPTDAIDATVTSTDLGTGRDRRLARLAGHVRRRLERPRVRRRLHARAPARASASRPGAPTGPSSSVEVGVHPGHRAHRRSAGRHFERAASATRSASRACRACSTGGSSSGRRLPGDAPGVTRRLEIPIRARAARDRARRLGRRRPVRRAPCGATSRRLGPPRTPDSGSSPLSTSVFVAETRMGPARRRTSTRSSSRARSRTSTTGSASSAPATRAVGPSGWRRLDAAVGGRASRPATTRRPSVVINEVMTGDNGWIEFYNPTLGDDLAARLHA